MTDDQPRTENEGAASERYPDIRPERYYDELGEEEWERLEAGPKARFEFDNTVEYLGAHLPGEGHILDAGGAAGRYTVWLAEQGYEVTLTDVSDVQLELAREKVVEHGIGDRVTVQYGDIRELPFDEGAFDAVCCLGGPISHVIDPVQRRHAVRELHRVATDGRAGVRLGDGLHRGRRADDAGRARV